MGLLGDVAFQVGADFFFDHAVVGLFFFAGVGQGVFDHAFGAFHEAVFAHVETPRYDFGSGLNSPCQFVDGDDGKDDAVFAEVTAVFNNQIFDYIRSRAGVDADAAYVDASGFAGAEFVELENVAAFDQHHFSD